MAAKTIRRTGFAAGALRVRHARPPRERCGLPIDGTARGLEFAFQLLVFAPQSLTLGFGSAQVLTEPLVFAPQFVDDLRIVRGRGLVALRHTAVMPNP
jgi:hypothetical protein